MRGLFEKYKKYIYIVVGLLVLWVVYTQVFAAGAPFASILSVGSSTMSQEKANEIFKEQTQLAAELHFLDTIRFDPTFFQNPLFSGLIDFSKPLPEEPVGRPNPFAPVSGTVTASSTSR
jgi:hypothetical protein